MTESQRRTLQCLLDATKKLPPQERLEAMLVSARTHLSLYQQENDEEGAAIYLPLVELIQSAASEPDLLEKVKFGMYFKNSFNRAEEAKKNFWDNTDAVGIEFLSLIYEWKQLNFRGTLWVKWKDSGALFDIPCDLNVSGQRHPEGIVVDLIYSPREEKIPDFLSDLIPTVFSRQVRYNLSGAILRETYPCLGLGSLARTTIDYDGRLPEERSARFIVDKASKQIAPIVEEGRFITPLRNSISKAQRIISFNGGIDEMARQVLGDVLIQTVVNDNPGGNQDSEGDLFVSDKFSVNFSRSMMYSVETVFPVGPWWLLDIRAIFNLD